MKSVLSKRADNCGQITKGLVANPDTTPMARSLRLAGGKNANKPGLTVDVDIGLRSRKLFKEPPLS